MDNFENKTYSNGQLGAIYKQTIPLVNPARVTALINGVLVQLNTEIKGSTEYIGLPSYKPHFKGPIRLQDHGDLVSFRNIWVREL